MFQRVSLNLRTAIRHPIRVYKLAVREVKEALLWEYYYSALREPKTRTTVALSPKKEDIVNELRKNGLNVIDFEIHQREFRQYLEKAQYDKFPKYYGGGKARNFIEKSLEHYLAAQVLQISRDDVYIDVASGNSPAAEIYHKLYGCETYRQDLMFPQGIHGNTIGGDACSMPIKNGFATKMALHCSFEHFERDSDIRFIKEASRVLKEGGRLCIVPLYLFESYVILTDPVAMPRGGILFDSDANLYCTKGSLYRERHGRFYDVPHLVDRIIKNSDLKPTFYVVKNEKEIDTSCYAMFVALFEKKS